MTKNLFLTGKPGSGKTSLIKELCRPYLKSIGGFYTEEIRESGERKGFMLKTFDGKQGILAKKGMKSANKLNKYGIDIDVLNKIGVNSLREALKEKEIIVIDEIGSMEIISEEFRKILLVCLASQRRVLATIRYNAQPFTDEVKTMADTNLIYLSRENIFEVRKQVQEWLEESIMNYE